MKKIAIISAFPQGMNTGMLTVEYSFPKELLDEYTVDRYCIESRFNISAPSFTKLEYNKLDNVEILRNYDRIIYWGDFLHWLGYLKHDIRLRNRNADTYNQLVELYFHCVFLENEPELRRRSMMIGGTIYPLSRADLLNERYKNALFNLVNDASFVGFRDAYSSAFAKLHFGILGGTLEFDPAFLLNTNHISSAKSSKPYLCYSFGRSGKNDQLLSFIKHYARAKGLFVVNIDWLGLESKTNFLNKKLSVIKGANVVFTDIYHMGVNALREKINVIMFGNALDAGSSSLADKKKEILFYQELIQEAYIQCESIPEKSKYDTLVGRVDDAVAMYKYSQYHTLLANRIKDYKMRVIHNIKHNPI
jgi:hypothetical protein